MFLYMNNRDWRGEMAESDEVFFEIQNGPNPNTPEQIDALCDRRPQYERYREFGAKALMAKKQKEEEQSMENMTETKMTESEINKSTQLIPEVTLSFGYGDFPRDGRPAWGARFIFPDDYLGDRSSMAKINGESIAGSQELQDWLNKEVLVSDPRILKDSKSRKKDNLKMNPFSQARNVARLLAKNWTIQKSSEKEVILYQDEYGIIKANPKGSYGYLYVVAYPREFSVPAPVTPDTAG